MSILNTSYCGSIWHHGIKGQKWGVRRSPEELGHTKGSDSGLDQIEKCVRMGQESFRSKKGFSVALDKFSKFCLKPGAKHSKEFFDVGYKTTDSELLFRHIEEGFELSKKQNVKPAYGGATKFEIRMPLGVTKKRTFLTGWIVDNPGDEPRLTTSHRIDDD